MDAIDLGRAAKAPFADKDWISKSLMGLLWTLLVVTAPVIYGAQLEYIRRVAQGREDLPTWDDFGTKWVQGLLLSIAGFIYFLPISILGAIMLVPGIIAAAASDGDAGGALLGGGACLFGVIAVIYIAAVSIFFYGAIVNYAIKGSFGALFEVGEIMRHVRDGSGYWNAWLWALVVGFVASTAASILSATGIGAILYGAVAYLAAMATGHLFGQWAARSYQVATPSVAPAGYAPPAGYMPPTGYAAPPAAPAPTEYAPPAPPAPAPTEYAPPAPAPTEYAPPAPPAPADYTPPAPPAPPAPPSEPEA
jgi:hypothetical protein